MIETNRVGDEAFPLINRAVSKTYYTTTEKSTEERVARELTQYTEHNRTNFLGKIIDHEGVNENDQKIVGLFDWMDQPIRYLHHIDNVNKLMYLCDNITNGWNKVCISEEVLSAADLEANESKLNDVVLAIACMWSSQQKVPTKSLRRSISPTHKYIYDMKLLVRMRNTSAARMFESGRATMLKRQYPFMAEWMAQMIKDVDESSPFPMGEQFIMRFAFENKAARRADGRGTELCLVLFTREVFMGCFGGKYSMYRFFMVTLKLNEFA